MSTWQKRLLFFYYCNFIKKLAVKARQKQRKRFSHFIHKVKGQRERKKVKGFVLL